jgi:hypothetical protein
MMFQIDSAFNRNRGKCSGHKEPYRAVVNSGEAAEGQLAAGELRVSPLSPNREFASDLMESRKVPVLVQMDFIRISQRKNHNVEAIQQHGTHLDSAPAALPETAPCLKNYITFDSNLVVE